MNYHLNNLVNKTKTIVPFNPQIITSENYMKTEKIITDSGSIIYGGATNIQFLADTATVLSRNPGPLIQMYGAGGQNGSVGLNLDTFQSLQSVKDGRKNGINPATQILAIDNGQYSSDLVFNTAPPSLYDYYLPACEERMKISANGNVSINNNLTVNDTTNLYSLTVSNGCTLNSLTVSNGSTLNNLSVSNGSTLNNLSVSNGSTLNSLSVSNGSTLNSLSVSNGCTLNNLSVSNESILNNLSVSNDTILYNLTVNGGITLDGSVNINNNIIAKNLYLNDGTTSSLPIWNEIISGTTTGNLLVDSYAVINNAQIQNAQIFGSCRSKQLFIGNEGATINGPLTVLLGWTANLDSLIVNNPIELNYQPSSVVDFTSKDGYQIGITNTLGCMIGATLPGTTFDGLYNIYSISTSSTVLTNIGSLTLQPNGIYNINLNVKINPISNNTYDPFGPIILNYINSAQFYLSSESSLTGGGLLANSINCGSFYNSNFNSCQNDTYINLTMPYNTSYYQNYYNNLGLGPTLNANVIYLWMNITYYGTPFLSQFNVIYNATRSG